MESRRFWLGLVDAAWERRPIVWLSGVRRAGKTTLAKSVAAAEFYDCELPSVRRLLEDPEAFLGSLTQQRLVLDEIHRLPNPSEVLKIAADHFPKLRILATGSSTLAATAKFSDTLTGRKEEIHLTPMNADDLKEFGVTDIKRRLHRGGLPPFFLSADYPEREFQEWMDSFWAKDVQELFRLEKRASFQKFLEMTALHSGGMFVAQTYAAPCQISHTTVATYLEALEQTGVVAVLKPFAKNRAAEIVAAPKVYAFDTGFVCYYRGWDKLREDDCGILWEHMVLNEILSRNLSWKVGYWRDKQGHEVDFILTKRNGPPVAVECKWKAGEFNVGNLAKFRNRYPDGANWLVASDVDRPRKKRVGGLEIEVLGLRHLGERLASSGHFQDKSP